ncbi:MAG: beta-lactamase family protein [Rhodospirillales bacterium]|nr:beta-lactamase family protein [Rhodospirillales bacterium]MDE2576505.1 beta-lactamase family protein [Rhodospirillales bacterium]
MPAGLRTAVATDDVAGPPVPWWSFTKTALAAAALVLAGEGALALDAPAAGRPFTLRQLLQHRAGLADYGALPAYHAAVAAGDAPWPAAMLLDRVAADRLRDAPGAGWGYSNIGYLLVRRMIEAATGQTLDAALRRLVLAPLGLATVRLAETPADLAATAWGNAGGYDPRWVYHGLLIGPPAAAARLLAGLLAGRLLAPELLAAMLEAHPVPGTWPGRPWREAGYGLGLMIGRGTDGQHYVGHSGGGPGSTAAVYRRLAPPGPVGAAFAPLDDPGVVERRAMALAAA